MVELVYKFDEKSYCKCLHEKVRLEQWSRKVQNIGGGRHFKYRVSVSFLDCYTDIRVINRKWHYFHKIYYSM